MANKISQQTVQQWANEYIMPHTRIELIRDVALILAASAATATLAYYTYTYAFANPVARGIKNFNRNCFLNAALQVICNTSLLDLWNKSKDQNIAVKTFIDNWKGLDSTDTYDDEESIRHIYEFLRLKYGQIYDSTEAFLPIIDSMNSKQCWTYWIKRKETITGSTDLTDYKSKTHLPAVQICVKGTLDEAWNDYLKGEEIEMTVRGELRKITISDELKKLPPVLCLCFKRYEYQDDIAQKIHRSMKCPAYLSLPLSDSKKQYALKAFVVHEGKSVEDGHYYACAKVPDEDGQMRWIQYNDAYTYYLSEEKALKLAEQSLYVVYEETAVLNKPLGIVNLKGDTCFVNAALQMILHIPVLQEAWVDSREEKHENQGLYVAIDEMIKGYAAFPRQTPYKNFNLMQTIREHLKCGILDENDEDRGQGDGQEAFGKMIDLIKKHQMLSDWITYIKRIGENDITKSRYCNLQEVPTLNLDLDPGEEDQCDTLADCWERQCQLEEIEADNELIKKRQVVIDVPELLLMSFNRFKLMGEDFRKDHTKIECPLDDFYPTGLHDKPSYRLKGFVVHQGATKESGHYYACIRLEDGKWYKFNDAEVTEMSEKDVRETVPSSYYVAYEKKLESGKTWE